MRLKQPVRGIHIGPTCVDGSPFKITDKDVEAAHAHLNLGHKGYICARSKKDLAAFLIHEIAHLMSESGHDDRWRRSLRQMGARVPAAHRKRPRKK